jgi:hypothetical protein
MDVEGIRNGAIDSRVLLKTSFSTRCDICYKTLKRHSEKTFEEVIQRAKYWHSEKTFEEVIQTTPTRKLSEVIKE